MPLFPYALNPLDIDGSSRSVYKFTAGLSFTIFHPWETVVALLYGIYLLRSCGEIKSLCNTFLPETRYTYS